MTQPSLEQQIADLQERVKRLEATLDKDNTPTKARSNKNQSPKEFLMGKATKADTQKLLVLAYYLEHNQNLESFNVTDLEEVFRLAKEKPPKNINDTVNKNVTRGFLMEAKERKDMKKTWTLTNTGELQVENELTR